MSTTSPHDPKLDETARLGAEFIRTCVEPILPPSDDGKYVAVAVAEADFEVDANDYQAIAKIRQRHPKAEIWLGRVGRPAAYTLRSFK